MNKKTEEILSAIQALTREEKENIYGVLQKELFAVPVDFEIVYKNQQKDFAVERIIHLDRLNEIWGVRLAGVALSLGVRSCTYDDALALVNEENERLLTQEEWSLIEENKNQLDKIFNVLHKHGVDFTPIQWTCEHWLPGGYCKCPERLMSSVGARAFQPKTGSMFVRPKYFIRLVRTSVNAEKF